MSPPPIPDRIPALQWRAPAFVWTPLALALAIGWPAGLFVDDPGLRAAALVIGAAVFALALLALGVSFGIGRAPKARRIVVLYVVVSGALVALAAPFLFAQAIGSEQGMAMFAAPLTLLLGLPTALASGVVFAWIALTPPRKPSARDIAHDVQPFR